jgi:glyoxylase-like metal-dependent hydrolase (beta-lactamase superfamily II)
MTAHPSTADRPVGPHTTVLTGQDNGKYPHGNSVVIRGPHGVVLIDPSLSVSDRGGAGVEIDRVLVSHAHEDHLSGLHLFPAASVHAHHEDLLGVHSIDGLMQIYGMSPAGEAEWRNTVHGQFRYRPRPDATGFADGDVFDLGGGVTVRCVHLAGHTRGHSGFFVESDGVFFVGDIDLTGFGPYYGDHWSSLVDFEAAIARVRTIEARTYVTFHQKGVVEGQATFNQMLDGFAAVINRREAAMLAFLGEPHTLEDMAAHRFMYRPGVEGVYFHDAERRCATLHLERLLPTGAVIELEPGLYRAV